ncbi:hypothetical protein Hanom_Chr10g00947871 [Helianthus anomalus]
MQIRLWLRINDKIFKGLDAFQTKIVQDIKKATLWWMNNRSIGVNLSIWSTFSG